MIHAIDLEKHIAITSVPLVRKICKPLEDICNIKFFRYLKLYKNGKRVVLSNNPDAIRYMYSAGNWVNLWYDGNFPEFLKPGWHNWQINRLLDSREIEEKIENDLISILKVNHGLTFVHAGKDYYEVFSFDSDLKNIYLLDRSLILRFVYYFKEQAIKLIEISDSDGIWLPAPTFPKKEKTTEKFVKFLNDTKITRYYLGGEYGDAYLTEKELTCIKWMMVGKTAEEIAIIENNAIKTIYNHIENIKAKFNCTKQTQIIKLILDTGLI